jgi:hypothetical protein
MTNLTISMAKKLVGPTPPEMFPRGQLLMISAFYVFIFIAMRLLLVFPFHVLACCFGS